MRSPLLRLIPAALLLSCSHPNPSLPASQDAGRAPLVESPRDLGFSSPLPQSALPTTPPKIALGNFQSQIDSFGTGPVQTDWIPRKVGLLLARAQYFGRLDDYDTCDQLSQRLLKERPKDNESLVLRVTVLEALHRFDEALALLDKLKPPLGRLTPRVEGLRASILAAKGKLDEALAIQHRLSTEQPHLSNMGMEAALLGQLGRTDEAERLFIAAQQHFPDVSPFPVAWLWFQEGLMWERRGDLSRARALYTAALERLPEYAAAAGHLAGIEAATGDRDKAIARLREVIARSDDPEYVGQLAGLLDEGDAAQKPAQKKEADALRARATHGFDALLAKHPEAFADHAARFFEAAGRDPKRALSLAEDNAKRRPTAEAEQLVVECALAANAPKPACAAADAMLAVCKTSCAPHQHVLASRAYDLCSQKDRAKAEIDAASRTH